MKCRPLSNDGDMMPVWSKDQLKTGVHAVAQAVTTRLQFFSGEWWENEDIGFNMPTYLIQALRVSEMDIAARYVSQYISETPGVDSIKDVQYSYDKHNMNFSCVVTAIGDDERIEVTIDGVL